MRITVVCVGKQKDRAVAELVGGYGKRLPPGLRLEWIEVAAAPGKGSREKAMAQEAARVRERIPARALVMALSERGRKLDSMEFSRRLGRVRDQGRDLCFTIGGADGFDPAFLKAADEVISLSALTFPHELVRAILAEQIYRAFSILKGDPYHRA